MHLPIHPFLSAIWPPLALAAKNPLEVATYPDILWAVAAGGNVRVTGLSEPDR